MVIIFKNNINFLKIFVGLYFNNFYIIIWNEIIKGEKRGILLFLKCFLDFLKVDFKINCYLEEKGNKFF